jgi:hypothetical protein
MATQISHKHATSKLRHAERFSCKPHGSWLFLNNFSAAMGSLNGKEHGLHKTRRGRSIVAVPTIDDMNFDPLTGFGANATLRAGCAKSFLESEPVVSCAD